MYFIKCVKKGFSFQKVEAAAIRSYPWGRAEGKTARAQAVFIPEEGFSLRMSRAVQEIPADNRLVWAINFFPEDSYDYFCFSMAPDGTLQWDIGPGETGRYSCGRAPSPQYACRVDDGLWQAELSVPLGLIEKACRRKDLDRGSILEGNFYSVEGPETIGCWSGVTAKRPSVHCPGGFGQIILA